MPDDGNEREQGRKKGGERKRNNRGERERQSKVMFNTNKC